MKSDMKVYYPQLKVLVVVAVKGHHPPDARYLLCLQHTSDVTFVAAGCWASCQAAGTFNMHNFVLPRHIP